MKFSRGRRAKEHKKWKHLQNGDIGLNSETRLVTKLPDSPVLRLVSCSVFLAVVILMVTYGSIFSAYCNPSADNFVSVELLDSLLLDLANEGLIKKGDKALFVCSGIGAVIDDSRFLNADEIDLVLESDESFDFVFAFGFEENEFLDHIVKVGGILVTELSDFSIALQKLSNYKVVYIKQYSSTILAMRKTSSTSELVDSSVKRQLCESKFEARKTTLNSLEDVLLEPPRKVLAKSRKSLNKFKYLPDLLGDSLEDYPRRIFIDVSLQDEKDGALAWFNENYPTRNKHFETFSIEMVAEGTSKTAAPSINVSSWLMKNVKEDEFVVMKAEAEVVDEMIKNRIINLVDELFLECQNQWERKKSKRAYWECLALYGRLRDKGVAVHQWWS